MTPCIICGKLVENRGRTKYCWDCRKEKQRVYARKKSKTRIISKASLEKYKKKQVEVYHQKFPNARYYSK